MYSDKSLRVSFAFLDEQGNIKPEMSIDFPTTKGALQKMLEQNGVDYKSVGQMTAVLYGNESGNALGSLTDITFDEATVNELNFLAIKLTELDEDGLGKFEAVIESGRHLGTTGVGNGDLTDYLNIVDNLDCFTFHPNMDASGYGEHLLSGPDNKVTDIIRTLRNNYGQEGEELGSYVECLRECADTEQFGRSMSYNNDGEFLESGYLIEEGKFRADFEGLLDILDEYRIWEPPDTFIKVMDVDLRGLLMEMHALGGNYTQDAAANLQTLLGGDCFIVVHAEKLTVFPAADVFHMDSPHCAEFPGACSGHARVFFAASNEGEGSSRLCSIHEIVTDALMMDVHNLSFDAVNIDAEFRDGINRVFTPYEWSNLSDAERGQVAGMVNRYDSASEGRVADYIHNLRGNAENNGREITQEDFLALLNAPFMAKAQNAQPDMLRVARDAARDMVARGDAEVYRLLPEGALKLSPMDVVKSNGLWFKEHREFAIKLGGMAGLRKWANRTADDISRQAMRGEHKKSRDAEL